VALDWTAIRLEYETTDISLADLAEKYDIKYPTIKSRNQRQGWEKNASKDASKDAKKDASKKIGPPFGSQNAKGHGAPKGNKNAVGNSGGIGGMPGERNQNFKHGFFSRIFPDDPETREIVESINLKSPLEMLWENIVIQYTAIARAQRLMFVKDQDDLTKVLKSSTSGEKSDSVTYELQFAWDKQAAFMAAQSRAMKTLEGMIARYEDMSGEKSKLELEKMKAEIAKLKGEEDPDNNSGEDNFKEALKGKVPEVWGDERRLSLSRFRPNSFKS